MFNAQKRWFSSFIQYHISYISHDNYDHLIHKHHHSTGQVGLWMRTAQMVTLVLSVAACSWGPFSPWLMNRGVSSCFKGTIWLFNIAMV